MICNGQGLKALSAPAAVGMPWPSLLLLAGFTILLREDAATQNALRGSRDEHTCGGGTGCEGLEAAPESAAWPPPAI